jgi:hypothetical protein
LEKNVSNRKYCGVKKMEKAEIRISFQKYIPSDKIMLRMAEIIFDTRRLKRR